MHIVEDFHQINVQAEMLFCYHFLIVEILMKILEDAIWQYG